MSYLTTKNQYITVDGNKIAYRELSKGKSKLPLLMLVHLAATLDNWDPKLLDLIAEKHHVIVVDLPICRGVFKKSHCFLGGLRWSKLF